MKGIYEGKRYGPREERRGRHGNRRVGKDAEAWNRSPFKKELTMTNPLVLLIIFLALIGCKVESEPINYGSDACHFCSMTIVDKQHAAEYVTHTGKVFKFDAIECMMNSIKDGGDTEITLFLVNSIENPGQLIDATEATYLISESIPSPMGENLSAFKTKELAENVRSEQTGQIFTWQAIKERFKIQ